jgi:hypothetical protein
MSEYDVPIRPHKAELLRLAIRKHNITSFADLGGCWGVHAGYALDALASHPSIARAYVADRYVTALSRERGAREARLEFVTGLINDPALIDPFPTVDALVMYDILLHQVDLDWDAFLAAWAAKTRVLVVYNQMWVGEGPSVRFVDRGCDWYLANVHYSSAAAIEAWFDDLDGVDQRIGRRKRDAFFFWQWGITRDDLIAHVERLGFSLDYFQDYGVFADRPLIRNQGFVFVRRA